MREEDLPEVYRYIGGLIRTMSGYAYMVGGRPDHVHILASLPVGMSIADYVRAIKANTSRWIKRLDAGYHDFSWQGGYGAFSVSESMKETVIRYIANQKEHHRQHSALEEFCLFLEKNGLQKEENYLVENNK